MENLDFLKQKYNLHNSEEVASAAKRTKTRTKEKISQKPLDQIQNYLDRFKEIIERKDPQERERGLTALKQVLYEKFVIKPGEVSEAAFLLEQRIARDLGHGDIEITEEFKEEKTEQIINDQKKSLDKWVNYLASVDAIYPDWAKYWTFRSMLEMGRLQKEEDKDGKETASFQKRAKDTVAPFPQLNPRALAMTISSVEARLEEKNKPKDKRKQTENKSIKLTEKEFEKLVSTENFSKIYTQFLIEMPEYSRDGLKETRGKWVKYERGTDGVKLADSLEGYPLEWCTANPDTARSQLSGGDFYVYYSLDQQNDPKIPRVAIRMHGGSIAEVRGIAAGQNMDPYIGDVVEEKMGEFGEEGEQYKKKADDMKRLTEIETKIEEGQELAKKELRFLYEIDVPIQGFGQDSDPRINELRSKRDYRTDIKYIFDGSSPGRTAYSNEEINKKTRVIFGTWELRKGGMVPDHLKFVEHLRLGYELDLGVLKKLIEFGKTDYIARMEYDNDKGQISSNLGCFIGLDLDTAKYFIGKGYAESVGNFIKSFRSVYHADIAQILIENGNANVVADMFLYFDVSDHTVISKQILEHGCDTASDIPLRDFHGLNKEVVKFLILNSKSLEAFSNNIHKFHDLDQEIAELLIECGHFYIVLYHLKEFKNINQSEIFRLILEEKPFSLRNVFPFTDLDQYTAKLFIEKGLTNLLVSKLSCFKGLSKEVADILIGDGQRGSYKNQVKKNLSSFSGLDQEFIKSLF